MRHLTLAAILLGQMAVPVAVGVYSPVSAHGDVKPQAVDTAGLPDLGEEWLEENPFRDPDGEHWARAIEVGSSGYNSNCARCHGLEVVSGGLAPDLRYLEANFDGDEWYLERYQNGYTQNGITKMPAFGELLGQEAAWAIRTYIETRPDDGALEEYGDELATIRDDLIAKADMVASGDKTVADFTAETNALRTTMAEIADALETGSGAPKAESPASRAVAYLDGSPNSLKNAAEALTVGLSAAQ